MHLIDFERITVEFKCPECGAKVEVDLDNILQVGNPFCGECDCDYEVAGSTASVQLK